MKPAPLCDRRGIHLFTNGRCLLAAVPAASAHTASTAHAVVAAGKMDAAGHAVMVRIAASPGAHGGAGGAALLPPPVLVVAGCDDAPSVEEVDACALAVAPDGATVAIAVTNTNEVRLYKVVADDELTPLHYHGNITRLAHVTRALAYDPLGRFL